MAINGAGTAERDAQRVWSALDGFRIEVPSWGFANTGTRFGKFVQGGAATTIEEKFSDAAQVNALTGASPTVALHVLWDLPGGKADVPAIRLPSTIPAVMGVSSRLKPWMGRCDDFKALVIWLGKQAEEGDTRFLDCIVLNQVRLNQLAKDHTTALKEILPGCVAVQEEGLARR